MKAWHGTKLFQPDWSGWSHSVACPAELPTDEFIRVILNAFWQPLEFELPECIRPWRRWIDTSVGTPNDIVLWDAGPLIMETKYVANSRSVVVLHTNNCGGKRLAQQELAAYTLYY
jgi:isoamylase